MNKKRLIKLFSFLLVIMILILTITLNKNYHFNNIINDYNSYKKYKKYNYISINIKNKKIHRLTPNEIGDSKYDGYIINYDNVDILVLLKKNTNISDIVNVAKKKDNIIVKNIKNNKDKIDKNINFASDYYTNNFSINYNIARIKLIILYSIIGLFLYLILKEIFLIIKNK